MLISLETNKAYIDTLVRAQAFQICASRDPSCDITGIHRMLVDLYVAKMMYDEGGVINKIREINTVLDSRISEANGVTRSEIIKFISAMRDDTWMHNKMEEISDKLSQIQLTQERIELNVTPIKHVPMPVQRSVIPPVRQAPKTDVAETGSEKKNTPHSKVVNGKKKCRNCDKWLAVSEFQCSGGRPTSANCKACELIKEHEARVSAIVNTDDFRKLEEAINEMPKGHIFVAAQVAVIINDTSYNFAHTTKMLKHMKNVRLAPGVKLGNKDARKYIKL